MLLHYFHFKKFAFLTYKTTFSYCIKGCDRDTYSLESQRQLCGASAHAIDLLPDPKIPGNDWASGMIRDKGEAADSR